MSTTTPYLGLLKPEGSELVNVVTALNQNYDKIDSKTQTLNGRVASVETVLGLDTEWAEWTLDTVYHGSTLIVPTVTRSDYLQLGTLVFVDVEFSVPNATYGTGLKFDIELPKGYSSAMQGTAVFDRSDGIQVMYFFIFSGTYGTAVALKDFDPAAIEDSGAAGGTYSGTFVGAFSYRTDEI